MKDLLATLGARRGRRRGLELVIRYSEGTPREAEAYRSGCGVVLLEMRSPVFLRGADRMRFLHGQCTNHVRSLHPGDSKEALVLDNKGRGLGHIRYLVGEEEILVQADRLQVTDLLAHWRRFLVIEEVEITEASEEAVLFLVGGPTSQEVLASTLGLSGGPEPPPHRVSMGSDEVLLWPQDEGGGPGHGVLVPTASATRFLERVLAHGGKPVGFDAFQALRIAAGRPWFGVDYGPECLPLETGLEEECVAYDKGCYLGQEQVAHQKHRGRPRRMVRALIFDEDTGEVSGPPAPGDEVFLEGASGGSLRSFAGPPIVPRPVGLALLRGAPESGIEAEVRPAAGGSPLRARVCALQELRSSW